MCFLFGVWNQHVIVISCALFRPAMFIFLFCFVYRIWSPIFALLMFVRARSFSLSLALAYCCCCCCCFSFQSGVFFLRSVGFSFAIVSLNRGVSIINKTFRHLHFILPDDSVGTYTITIFWTIDKRTSRTFRFNLCFWWSHRVLATILEIPWNIVCY